MFYYLHKEDPNKDFTHLLRNICCSLLWRQFMLLSMTVTVVKQQGFNSYNQVNKFK